MGMVKCEKSQNVILGLEIMGSTNSYAPAVAVATSLNVIHIWESSDCL